MPPLPAFLSAMMPKPDRQTTIAQGEADCRPELPVIRPPSEWRSMLLRSTRGCSWNRCRFCGIYPALGEPAFSIRHVDEVKRDILWYREEMPEMTAAFLGDADPLCRAPAESEEILAFLRETHPQVTRVTAYARASTIHKLGEAVMCRLAGAGLDRIHLGLESGDLATLRYHVKGQSPRLVERACAHLGAAGIETSVYMLLGLGGMRDWERHIDATAALLRVIRPNFIRIRRLWIYEATPFTERESPLMPEIRAGRFVPQSAEGTVLELRRLIEQLDSGTGRIVCDHRNNYVAVEGDLPRDRRAMLERIDAFLTLPRETREKHYAAAGSRI